RLLPSSAFMTTPRLPTLWSVPRTLLWAGAAGSCGSAATGCGASHGASRKAMASPTPILCIDPPYFPRVYTPSSPRSVRRGVVDGADQLVGTGVLHVVAGALEQREPRAGHLAAQALGRVPRAAVVRSLDDEQRLADAGIPGTHRSGAVVEHRALE